jgi:hypothetical protein
MELLNVSGCHAGRHRLYALALAGSEQTRPVNRSPATLLGTSEPSQERSKPHIKCGLPVCFGGGHFGASREHLNSLHRSSPGRVVLEPIRA